MKKILQFLSGPEKVTRAGALLLASALLLFSCAQPGASDSSSQPVIKEQTITFDNTARAFELGPDVVDVTIKNVQGKKIYFARGNLSAEESYWVHSKGLNAISADKLSYITSYTGLGTNSQASKAVMLNNNISRTDACIRYPKRQSSSHPYAAKAGKSGEEPLPLQTQKTKDDFEEGVTKRVFKIVPNDAEGFSKSTSDKIEFTAMAVGDNVIVWRISEDRNGSETTTKITQDMCKAMRDNFEAILPYETALFGNKAEVLVQENNGTPNNYYDIKYYSDLANFTNILIFDLSKVANSGALGFFSFTDYTNDTEVSNFGNFLYISDSNVISDEPTKRDDHGVAWDVYNTIGHEYMHSLQYARKCLDTDVYTWNYAYGELIGQLCEYIFAQKLGIPASLTVIPFRFDSLLSNYYYSGIFEYTQDGLSSQPGSGTATYPNVLALGLFLTKNYGGQKIISEMVMNEDCYWPSIINAVKTASGKTVTKEEIFLHYLEAYNCKGSPYYEKMKNETEITAKGITIHVPGFDPLDLTWNGYFEDTVDWAKKGFYKFDGTDGTISEMTFDEKTYPLKLRGEGGYHICTVGDSLATDDTVTLKINRRGAGTKERLYILISD